MNRGPQTAREASIEEGGKTYHQIPGGRVTPEGLEEVIAAKRDQVASAEDAVSTAEEWVREWKRQVEEHCAKEAVVRRRYEECVGAVRAPPPGVGPEDAAPHPGPRSCPHRRRSGSLHRPGSPSGRRWRRERRHRPSVRPRRAASRPWPEAAERGTSGRKSSTVLTPSRRST